MLWSEAFRRGALRYPLVLPGDPDACDPDGIPDYAFLDSPQPMVRKHAEMAANYEILTDNLINVSHIEFVHAHSFQSGGGLLSGRYRAQHDDDGLIWSRWLVKDTAPPRFALPQLGDASVDRWSNTKPLRGRLTAGIPKRRPA